MVALGTPSFSGIQLPVRRSHRRIPHRRRRCRGQLTRRRALLARLRGAKTPAINSAIRGRPLTACEMVVQDWRGPELKSWGTSSPRHGSVSQCGVVLRRKEKANADPVHHLWLNLGRETEHHTERLENICGTAR